MQECIMQCRHNTLASTSHDHKCGHASSTRVRHTRQSKKVLKDTTADLAGKTSCNKRPDHSDLHKDTHSKARQRMEDMAGVHAAYRGAEANCADMGKNPRYTGARQLFPCPRTIHPPAKNILLDHNQRASSLSLQSSIVLLPLSVEKLSSLSFRS